MTTLALIALCGSLALLAAALLAARDARSASERSRARHASAPARAATRSWTVTLAPSPDDLSIAQIGFPGARARRLTAGSLRARVSGPFGDDYMALAAVAPSAGAGAPRALLLIVNRPSPLLDPVRVRVRLTAQRSLGGSTLRTRADVFARATLARTPALCDLSLHGRALGGSQLRALGAHGAAIAGFDAASAVAQAYDAACGLPYASTFRQAAQTGGGGPAPPAPQPAPEPAPPAPSPGPPVGKLPGEGCKPAPGYACPGAIAG
ncbi:MAG TPA: hypothetical protein VMF09_09075 [Solirubrobacteraceae bacterium]|nr:hypothetical protein [Solirubrobacteraceae bacterium]